MITTGNALKTIEFKGAFMSNSLEFARFASPDFILIKEAVMIFASQLQASAAGASIDNAPEEDKRYLFSML